jgi:transposase
VPETNKTKEPEANASTANTAGTASSKSSRAKMGRPASREVAERRKKVEEMRAEGKSYKEIAEELGVKLATVQQDAKYNAAKERREAEMAEAEETAKANAEDDEAAETDEPDEDNGNDESGETAGKRPAHLDPSEDDKSSKPITCRFPSWLIAELDEMRLERGETRNSLITKILVDAVKESKGEKDEGPLTRKDIREIFEETTKASQETYQAILGTLIANQIDQRVRELRELEAPTYEPPTTATDGAIERAMPSLWHRLVCALQGRRY